MARIENIIDVDLSPPPQNGGLFGLKFSRGIYSDRHFDGIYGAWRARELLRLAGRNFCDIVEIGGGAGFLAYYARTLGFRRLAIIDLPQALCAQYMVLAGKFGSERVRFNADLEDGIRLLTTDSELSQSYGSAQILVNVDSFPEMPRTSAEAYVSRITPGTSLLSINQESGVANGDGMQGLVSAMASRNGLERVLRYPAWLRTGWVEEVYVKRA